MANITLHEATEQVRELLDQIDPETGELPAEYEQARAIVATKATAVAAYILETDRQVESVENYVRELQTRIRAQKSRTAWLRQYLAQHMAAAGVLKITDDRGIFSARLELARDASVEVFDEAQLPEEFIRTKVITEPNKATMKPLLETGMNIPGARLVRKDRLTIK
jgi:predicted  nucleic acid-binding Zn-ribbon protein